MGVNENFLNVTDNNKGMVENLEQIEEDFSIDNLLKEMEDLTETAESDVVYEYEDEDGQYLEYEEEDEDI